MERYGVGVILFLSIIPNPIFDFMGIAAGALRYPLKKFLLVGWFGKTLKGILIAYTCLWIVEWVTWLKWSIGVAQCNINRIIWFTVTLIKVWCMGKKTSSNHSRRFSRRTFLKGVPLGLIGTLAVGFIGRRFLSSAFQRNSGSFPKDSIFYPQDESKNL